jgi:hypothetical protein
MMYIIDTQKKRKACTRHHKFDEDNNPRMADNDWEPIWGLSPSLTGLWDCWKTQKMFRKICTMSTMVK